METAELQFLKSGCGDSVLSACALLKSQWPFTHFAPHMPPIYLLNQLYFLLSDRTLVDRELSLLQQSNQVRVFKLNGREGNELCVVLTEDYEASVRAMLNADGMRILEEEERRMKEIKRPASLPTRSAPNAATVDVSLTSSASSSAAAAAPIKSQSTNSSTASTLRFAPWPSSSSSSSSSLIPPTVTSTTSTPPPMPLPLHATSSSLRSKSSVLSSGSSANRPPLRRRKTASAVTTAANAAATPSSEPANKKLKTNHSGGVITAAPVEVLDLTDGDQPHEMPGLETAAGSVKAEGGKVEKKSASAPVSANMKSEYSRDAETKLSTAVSSPAAAASSTEIAVLPSISASSSTSAVPAPSALPPPFSRAPTMQQVLSATEAPQLFLTASGGVNPKLHVPLSDCAFDDRFPDMQQQAEDAQQLQQIVEGEEKEGLLASDGSFHSLSDSALSSPAVTNHFVNAADTNTLLVLFLTRFLPNFHEVSLTQEKLIAMLYSPFQFRFSPTFTADHAISVLLRMGLLLFRSASSYFLAVPAVSRLTHVLRSGRKEIRSLIHRRQFHEMPLRELINKPKLKTSPCRIEFHLREMLGSEEIIEMKHTTIGTIVSLVVKK